MYRVYVKDQTGEYPLYEPLDEELCIYDPILTQKTGYGGSFKFCILESHPYANKIGLLKTEVIVYRDEKEIFCGRVLKPRYNIQKIISVTVEGELCYLNDSQQAPYSIQGGTQEFIRRILEVHNSQVDEYKKIYPGIVTVTDPEDGVIRAEKRYTNTLDTLFAKLPDELGGYFRIRKEGGKKYLDYLWDYGGKNEQVIRFGENLLDIERYLNAGDIITCLIPLGAEVEYTDELGEKQVKQVDISSVNGGKNYIQSDAGIEKYGKIWGTKTWSDITDPERLLSKARAHLNESSALPESMQINALDLSLLDASVPEFELGYWTTLSSEPHGIEKELLLSERVIDLLDPTAGGITLGRNVKTFLDRVSSGQQDAMKAIEKTAASTSQEINRKVENATNLITGGLGGYVVLDNIDPVTGKRSHPWRILIMNTPDKDTAVNVIQINQNGIGFSTTGINGPYRNAWTIDGNLIADFITAGTMLADRIRGGTLELGGKGLGKDGSIIVMDVAGNRIGSWDKTGLTILKGIIQGVSAVFGGSNNENGAIEVRDANGKVICRLDKDGFFGNRGVIDFGPLYGDENEVRFGDFRVSADGSNILESEDGSVTIQTQEGGPFGEFVTICLRNNISGQETIISDHHIKTTAIQLKAATIETKEWGMYPYNGSLGYILDCIWNHPTWGLEALRSDIDDLISEQGR